MIAQAPAAVAGEAPNVAPEAETVAVAYNTKHEGIPMQMLLDIFLADCRRPIDLVAKVDNTQAITAISKGYSKKLRFLERTHRCSIGSLHELVEDGLMKVEYAPTVSHRGDGFTKVMTPAKFLAARDMMSMVSH